MSFVVTGFLVSFSLVLIFIFLFRHEERKGVRLFEHARKHADFFVLKTAYTCNEYVRFLRKDFFQQTLHFSFHTILRYILQCMVWTEKMVRRIMRKNKIIAKNAERESTTLSKLEEIALHKIESALTEEEKNAHREKILQGK